MHASHIFSVLAALILSVQTAPNFSTLHSRSLLGTSFGIPGQNATYDYIVVGGGTAGLTLATRLAEQQSGSVAVIEAGSFYEIGNGNISQVPASDGVYSGRSTTDWQPLVDWGYATTPQAGLDGDAIHYARGRCLGGSSARNYMVYQRGTTSSYQRWADIVGDDSYTFDKFLPYFEKSLKFTPPANDLRFNNGTPEYDDTVVGKGSGPLSLTFSHYVQAFGTWATKGLQEIGIPIIKNFQSGQLLGQSYSMFTINATDMTRDSSETSFLRRGLAYPNYKVYPQTLAKKITFDDSKKANGVIVDTEGLQYRLRATKEVILTAGVFGSPQLLLVSGVGPASTLQAQNIPVVADRPGVGQNMQDHIYFGPSYRVNGITFSSLANTAYASEQAGLYNAQPPTGIYTNPTTDVLAWEKIPDPLRSQFSDATKSKLAAFPPDWPEVEYLSLGAYLGYQADLATGDPGDGYNYASLAVSIVAPVSRGNLTISSPDAAVPAVINPNWLTDRADMDVAIAGFKRARQFWNTPSMSQFRIGEESFPGFALVPATADLMASGAAGNQTTDTGNGTSTSSNQTSPYPTGQNSTSGDANGHDGDQAIESIIKKSLNTIYHAACTCAMGKEDDRMAVTDTKGRVYGVQGLRVVDAATFPVLPPGHPQSTVYALAEKIACDISGGCQ